MSSLPPTNTARARLASTGVVATVASRDLALLRQAALFEGLDDWSVEQICDAGQKRRIKPGAPLFAQSQPAKALYVILSGRVRVSELTAEGHEVLLRFIEPGQPLGLMAAIADSVYPVTAETTEDSRVISWRQGTMERLMDRHPRLARNAMRQMVTRIEELQRRCVELATERVEQRVARAVLRLVEQTGKCVDGGVLLDIQLSRQDIAAMTGTTLFTVSRLLNRWQEEGLVSIGRQRVVIREGRKLALLAEAT